jgi:hypothetical protein
LTADGKRLPTQVQLGDLDGRQTPVQERHCGAGSLTDWHVAKGYRLWGRDEGSCIPSVHHIISAPGQEEEKTARQQEERSGVTTADGGDLGAATCAALFGLPIDIAE